MRKAPDENALGDLVRKVLEKPKYQHIHKGLVETVAAAELAKGRKKKETQKAVLSKLHQIGAAYFSQKPDYGEWTNELSSLPDDIHADRTKAYCVKVMESHYSTDERLPILNDFYSQILNSIRPIPSILDLACGLNPLALPWMPIDDETQYYGCDIFADMIDFLNTFAAHFGIHAKFETCNLLDAAFNNPAKIALLLKIIPCLEQLQKGFIPQLLDAIPAEYILFSYPISSLSGKSKGMRDNYTDQFTFIVSSKGWEYERFEFSSELAFLVKKNLMIDEEFDQIVYQITNSRKYRSMKIPRETILDLLEKELPRHEKKSKAIKIVKAKLHNITAPYLDDLDYAMAAQELEQVFSNRNNKSIKDVCIQFLQAHHSTNERLPYLEKFYAYIFKKIGNPCSILDLACGLNPFMIPLVEFPSSITYFAYDIHRPRIELINSFFSGLGIHGFAETRDILVRPPTQKVDAAFFFKEAHRMEKRRHGATRDLLRPLNVDHLFISLPNHSLNGKYDLRERMLKLTKDSIQGLGSILEIEDFPAETLFYIGLKNGKA